VTIFEKTAILQHFIDIDDETSEDVPCTQLMLFDL